MNKYTHKKRPYLAHAIQWDESNLESIAAMLPKAEVQMVGRVAFIRYEPGECDIMRPRDWIVKGENGDVKLYSDDIFRVKYEEVGNFG